MILSEILIRKRNLDRKLKAIDTYIKYLNSLEVVSAERYTSAINYKFDLLSKVRSHNILIENINKDTIINVGGVELSVFDALHLLKTLEDKMQTFIDSVVSPASMSFDLHDLFSKYDSLFEEYQRIYLAVLQSDLTTTWEG